jgi:hypothetical protein
MNDLSIYTQPDGVSCGPTCLHALYQYFSDPISLEQTIAEIPYLETGGTLAVLLACHALSRGYKASLHSFNLHVLDPTWVTRKNVLLIDKLHTQLTHTSDPKIKMTTKAYIHFLEQGGQLHFGEISFDSIRAYLDSKIPLLSGVCATYLYKNMRDYTSEDNQVVYDEWLGAPTGHFIVLRGYDRGTEQLHIADPYKPHPLSTNNYYSVYFSRWLHAHLLGIITYDAELLAIEPIELSRGKVCF